MLQERAIDGSKRGAFVGARVGDGTAVELDDPLHNGKDRCNARGGECLVSDSRDNVGRDGESKDFDESSGEGGEAERGHVGEVSGSICMETGGGEGIRERVEALLYRGRSRRGGGRRGWNWGSGATEWGGVGGDAGD